jgi:3',5'-cyclic AMP phosphodiesterase CpdA
MPLRLFHVSDLHFGREDKAAVAWFAERVKAERPDAVICTGDLTMRARTAEFAAAQAWLASLNVPVTIEPGNHDLPYYNPVARMLYPYRRMKAVERAIERPLALTGVMLVPLKTTARLQMRSLAWGRVSRSGLPAAVRQLAAKPADTIALVAVHHPLIRTGFTGHGDTQRGLAALEALAAAGADAVLSGHIHDPFDVTWEGRGRSVRLIGAGTLSMRVRSTPPSFNELRIEGDRLEVQVRPMQPDG